LESAIAISRTAPAWPMTRREIASEIAAGAGAAEVAIRGILPAPPLAPPAGGRRFLATIDGSG
jgi:hypothetical protein